MSRLNIILVFAAIVLAIVCGYLTGETATLFGITYYSLYDFIGQLFLNALKLVIIPLVVSSIIAGVARMGEEEKVAILGAKTFGFYSLTAITATLIGYFVVMAIEPGFMHADKSAFNYEVLKDVSVFDKIKDIFFRLIPHNIVQAAAEGQMLGLIAFSMLFGFFTAKIDVELSLIIQKFFRGVFQVMMKMTNFFIKFLPLGVFALVAKVTASSGLEAIQSSLWFFACMIAAYLIYGIGALSFYLYFIAKVNPIQHMIAMGPAILTAFTTSSSAATLPVTMECVEKRAGVSNRIASFTLPLGTSIHMAGTAIFVCVSVMFIAQVYNVPLSPSSQFLAILLSFIMSMGVAGIPSSSLVVVVVLLDILMLPKEGLAYLLVVERILDMFRTVMNVYSNSVNAVLVSRSEKENILIARPSSVA